MWMFLAGVLTGIVLTVVSVFAIFWYQKRKMKNQMNEILDEMEEDMLSGIMMGDEDDE